MSDSAQGGRRGDAGFSMIEALVSMTVLAVATAGFLRASGDTARQTAQLNDRILTRWVAEDAMAVLQASGAMSTQGVEMWGRRYVYEILREPLEAGALEKATVTVTDVTSDVAVTLFGYHITEGRFE